jgi:hypothetical protein
MEDAETLAAGAAIRRDRASRTSGVGEPRRPEPLLAGRVATLRNRLLRDRNGLAASLDHDRRIAAGALDAELVLELLRPTPSHEDRGRDEDGCRHPHARMVRKALVRPA